jgi:hypothetical protein
VVAPYHSSSYDARPEHRSWNWLHCLLGRPFEENERSSLRFLTVTVASDSSVVWHASILPVITRGMLTHFRFHPTRQTLKPYEAALSLLSLRTPTRTRTVTTFAVAYCKVMLCNTPPTSVGSTGRKARESQRADV